MDSSPEPHGILLFPLILDQAGTNTTLSCSNPRIIPAFIHIWLFCPGPGAHSRCLPGFFQGSEVEACRGSHLSSQGTSVSPVPSVPCRGRRWWPHRVTSWPRSSHIWVTKPHCHRRKPQAGWCLLRAGVGEGILLLPAAGMGSGQLFWAAVPKFPPGMEHPEPFLQRIPGWLCFRAGQRESLENSSELWFCPRSC